MQGLNLFKKLSQLRFAVGLTVVGLIISIIAGMMFFYQDTATYEKVNATITNIETEGAGEDTTYTVYVTYEVDGKKYESQLGAHQSNWDVGTVVECEYNVDDPANIRQGDGKIMSLVICLVGVAAFAYGVISLVKGIKTPSSEFSQYDRVKESQIDALKAEEIRNSNEPNEDFVFHFTGKLNQSYIMEDRFEEPVYEAICNGIKLFKDTEFEFKNHINGASSTKMIGHAVTTSYGNDSFSTAVKSAFKIDGENCWDVLASMGYGFEFSLNGIKAHYEVKHMGVNIGYAELAGTGAVNKEYENNPLGKLPTNGIFKVNCPRSEVEGMFLVCFCLSKTDTTIN